MIASNLIALAALVFLIIEGFKNLHGLSVKQLGAVLATAILTGALLVGSSIPRSDWSMRAVSILVVLMAAIGIHGLWKGVRRNGRS